MLVLLKVLLMPFGYKVSKWCSGIFVICINMAPELIRKAKNIGPRCFPRGCVPHRGPENQVATKTDCQTKQSSKWLRNETPNPKVCVCYFADIFEEFRIILLVWFKMEFPILFGSFWIYICICMIYFDIFGYLFEASRFGVNRTHGSAVWEVLAFRFLMIF